MSNKPFIFDSSCKIPCPPPAMLCFFLISFTMPMSSRILEWVCEPLALILYLISHIVFRAFVHRPSNPPTIRCLYLIQGAYLYLMQQPSNCCCIRSVTSKSSLTSICMSFRVHAMDLLPAWSQACICGRVFSVSRRIHTLATCPITSRTRSLAVKLTVISLAEPTSFELPLVTMDLFPAWSQTCVCLPQVYTFHQRSCQRTKKRLLGALEKAKDVLQVGSVIKSNLALIHSA